MAFLFQLFYPRYPKVAECMKRRHEMYNAQLQYIEEEEKKGNILAIRPDHPLDIGRIELNEEKLRAIYQHGYNTAIERLAEVRQFLHPHNH